MKKVLCVILSVVILVMPISVQATGDVTYEHQSIIEALGATEPIKESLGLSNVNFEDFSVASEIKAYVFIDNCFIESFKMYPLLISNSIKALAVNNNDTIQITTNYVDKINEIIDYSTRFAIIYDSTCAYLYTGNDLYVLGTFQQEVYGRGTINDISSILNSDSAISLNAINDIVKLNYVCNKSRIPIYYECSGISYVQQHNDTSCWAASTACIVNYYNGTSLTSRNVFNNTNSNYYDSDGAIYISYQDDVLNSYGLNYTYKLSAPSDSIIFSNIKNGKPLQGTFSYSDGYHDTVIYAVNISSPYIYVMDPMIGLLTATINSYNMKYFYTNTEEGETLTLCGAACVTW